MGGLFSHIQQRTYVNSKDPANPQQNLLSVNGTGTFSPLGAALLNYKIPWPTSSWFGLALSSGLVLHFGDGQVSASSLGWFGGPSVQLWNRLFLSVGAHIGDFSDFPPGLYKGAVIPPSYGELTGRTYPTTRFAFAVTYQTKAFTAGSTTAKSSTTGAASADSKKK